MIDFGLCYVQVIENRYFVAPHLNCRRYLSVLLPRARWDLLDSLHHPRSMVSSASPYVCCYPLKNHAKDGGCLDSFYHHFGNCTGEQTCLNRMFLNMLLKRACSALPLHRHRGKKSQGSCPPSREPERRKPRRPKIGRVTVCGVAERLRNGQHSRSASFLNPSTTPLAVARPTPRRWTVLDPFWAARRRTDISTFPPLPLSPA